MKTNILKDSRQGKFISAIFKYFKRRQWIGYMSNCILLFCILLPQTLICLVFPNTAKKLYHVKLPVKKIT